MSTTATLPELLLAPHTRPQVVTDCCALIEQQVAEMSGISGTAVKLAHRAVVAFAPGHVRYIIETLLPQMADQLQPYWEEFRLAGGSDFGDYLSKRGDEVAEALLSVTDARAAASRRPVIIRAYKSVRSHAGPHIRAALPALGAMVHKYAG
ncbi:MAG: DUF6918 family protein [Streptosporangiaceae bacterium]